MYCVIKWGMLAQPAPLPLILGAPRSGTTWLAKIFDSHPRVLYRHEPDLAIPDAGIPRICRLEDVPRYQDATVAFVETLILACNLKTAGKLPLFAKTGDPPLAHAARTGLVLALRLAQAVRAGRDTRMLSLPRDFGWNSGERPHVVIKSISSLGRAGLLAASLPEARIVLIVRNPLAQIASRLRGHATGMMRPFRLTPNLLATVEAERFGLTQARFDTLALVEQLAWEWAILNEKAIAELSTRGNVTVVRYTDLVLDPRGTARALLAFAGLPWHAAVERFVRGSTSYLGPDLYFHVRKRGRNPLHKWRAVLRAEDEARILAVVSGTLAGRLYR